MSGSLQHTRFVTVAWLLFTALSPAENGQRGSVAHDEETEDDEGDIRETLPVFCRDGAVVHEWLVKLVKAGVVSENQTYRIYKDERDTSEASNKSDKLVQLSRAEPSDDGAKHNHEESKDILLPLDPGVVLASTAKQLLRGDFNGRVDLQGCREQDSKRVDELHAVDQLVVLGHVQNDDGLGFTSIGGIGKCTHRDENDCYGNHDDSEHTRKFGRVLHAGLNGDDETNTLEGEDGCANEKCPVILVELDNVGNAVVVGESEDIVVVEIYQAKDDEKIRNQSQLLNVVDVAVQAEG